MPAAKTLGDTLRDARVALDLSLREVARQVKIAPSYLSDIENDRRVPAEELLGKLASLLKLDFDELMARAGRVGDDAERYLKKHPSAGVLFRRLAEKGVGEEHLKLLGRLAEKGVDEERLKELVEQVERERKKGR